MESILNYASEREDKKQQRLEEERLRTEEKKKKRNKLILWVLGWLFIFPVPLTILMLRNKEMNKKVKYGVIAGAWIVYIIFLLVNSGGNSDKQTAASSEENPVAVTTVSEEPVTTTQTTTTTPKETTVAETEPPKETTAKETKAPAKTTPKETEPPAETTTKIDERKAVENGDYSLVTPEFKETMDAYEAFYDKYIEIMNKFNSGDLNVMNDYMTILSELEEWTNKIDSIDESELTPADDAYYLLVTMRIEEKLVNMVQ